MNVFVAGATGVIGLPLLKLLREAGHTVTGTTRSQAKICDIEALGADAAVVDAFDAAAFKIAVVRAKPEVVIHQLTDLPDTLDPSQRLAVLERNARLRIDGTRNLMAAVRAAGAPRVVAQSIAFIYAPGPEPHREDDPLDSSEAQRTTVAGVQGLEAAVLHTPGVEGLVLRYGRVYGPGTWSGEQPTGNGILHVEAAAQAALLAMTNGEPGIYNVAEDDGAYSIERARRQLGFDPGFRIAG